MDSNTLTILGLLVGSPVVTTVLTQGVEFLKQRKDRSYTKKLQEIDLQQRQTELDLRRDEGLRQALLEFPFLKEAIPGTTLGYRGVKKNTGNSEHPIVLVEREKYGIRLSWKPKDIEGIYS